ncbi:HSP40/DnaJ peptide-binding protein, partial [Morchella conica CCBAS932]
GGKPNTKPKKCTTCAGKGYTESLRQIGRGLVTQENSPCAACSSTGQTYRDRDRCRRCKGTCVHEEKKVLELYIPRGSKHGDKIVLEGEADEAPDQETGNIVFVLDEKEHDVFDRSGADLSARLRVTLAEALTGFEKVVVKHLDGRGVLVKHPRGKVLRPGQVLRVKGEGMPRKRSEARGDLYLVVDIEFPKDGWSPEVERIRELLPKGEKEEIKAEQVDEVEYEEADLDEFGAEEGGQGGVWEDDDEDDEEDGQPQCAQA